MSERRWREPLDRPQPAALAQAEWRRSEFCPGLPASGTLAGSWPDTVTLAASTRRWAARRAACSAIRQLCLTLLFISEVLTTLHSSEDNKHGER